MGLIQLQNIVMDLGDSRFFRLFKIIICLQTIHSGVPTIKTSFIDVHCQTPRTCASGICYLKIMNSAEINTYLRYLSVKGLGVYASDCLPIKNTIVSCCRKHWSSYTQRHTLGCILPGPKRILNWYFKYFIYEDGVIHPPPGVKPLTITIYAPVSGIIDHVSNIKRYSLYKLQTVVGVKNCESRTTHYKFPTINTEKTRCAHSFLYCIIYVANMFWGGANFTHAISRAAESSLWWQHFFANPSSPLPMISISHAPCYTNNSFQMFPAKVIGFQLAVTHLMCSRIFSFQPQFDKSENVALWLVLFLPPHIRSS